MKKRQKKQPANKSNPHYNSVLDQDPSERTAGRVEGLSVYEQAYRKDPQ